MKPDAQCDINQYLDAIDLLFNYNILKIYNISRKMTMKMKKIKDVDPTLHIGTGDGVFSEDMKYRSSLKVFWESEYNKNAVTIGINPSKANDLRSDKILTTLGRFLDSYAFSKMLMSNIFENYSTGQSRLDQKNRFFHI